MFHLIIIACILVMAIISYLLGSINFAIIITRKINGNDIRNSGSGNAGMTNVMRSVGFWPGLTVFLCDFGKAALAVVLGRYLTVPLINLFITETGQNSDYIGYVIPFYGAFICGFACFIGHIYPIFFGFKGGKGVTTALGSLAVINWKAAVILFSLFLIIFAISRIISLASIIATAAYPFAVFVLYTVFPVGSYIDNLSKTIGIIPLSIRWLETISAALFAIVIILKHKENIKRLIKGEEKKLVLKK